MLLTKAPLPAGRSKKRGKYGREGGDWAKLGLGKEGEGLPGTHIADEKYFDLNFSYIMGKAAN
jgi:hypothetical protein